MARSRPKQLARSRESTKCKLEANSFGSQAEDLCPSHLEPKRRENIKQAFKCSTLESIPGLVSKSNRRLEHTKMTAAMRPTTFASKPKHEKALTKHQKAKRQKNDISECHLGDLCFTNLSSHEFSGTSSRHHAMRSNRVFEVLAGRSWAFSGK